VTGDEDVEMSEPKSLHSD